MRDHRGWTEEQGYEGEELVSASRKVLIRGHVFDYEDKAPFVASGESVLGALEYDVENDLIKCHECGGWFTSIAQHLANGKGIHGDLTVTEYKKRHGINLRGAGLIAIGMREKLKASLVVRKERNEPFKTTRKVTGQEFRGKIHDFGSWQERKNVNARCQAQTIFRIQVLAAQLGRTPTKAELAKAGLHSLFRDFGSYAKAIEETGLVPNAQGYHGRHHSKLPEGFPTKAQLDKEKKVWPWDRTSDGKLDEHKDAIPGTALRVAINKALEDDGPCEWVELREWVRDMRPETDVTGFRDEMYELLRSGQLIKDKHGVIHVTSIYYGLQVAS